MEINVLKSAFHNNFIFVFILFSDKLQFIKIQNLNKLNSNTCHFKKCMKIGELCTFYN